jgi:predicted permease
MNSFYISLSAVLPMFAMLALGVFLRRKGVVDDELVCSCAKTRHQEV